MLYLGGEEIICLIRLCELRRFRTSSSGVSASTLTVWIFIVALVSSSDIVEEPKLGQMRKRGNGAFVQSMRQRMVREIFREPLYEYGFLDLVTYLLVRRSEVHVV